MRVKTIKFFQGGTDPQNLPSVFGKNQTCTCCFAQTPLNKQ